MEKYTKTLMFGLVGAPTLAIAPHSCDILSQEVIPGTRVVYEVADMTANAIRSCLPVPLPTRSTVTVNQSDVDVWECDFYDPTISAQTIGPFIVFNRERESVDRGNVILHELSHTTDCFPHANYFSEGATEFHTLNQHPEYILHPDYAFNAFWVQWIEKHLKIPVLEEAFNCEKRSTVYELSKTVEERIMALEINDELKPWLIKYLDPNPSGLFSEDSDIETYIFTVQMALADPELLEEIRQHLQQYPKWVSDEFEEVINKNKNKKLPTLSNDAPLNWPWHLAGLGALVYSTTSYRKRRDYLEELWIETKKKFSTLFKRSN